MKLLKRTTDRDCATQPELLASEAKEAKLEGQHL